MHLLARQRGGQCLSDVYINAHSKLRWRCKEGHEWEAIPDNIQQGYWCPECTKRKIGDARRKYTIEDMQVLARQRGGECLSSIFTSVNEKLQWRCKEGHQWEAIPNNIQHGQWCPECAKKKIGDANRYYTIEDMKELARQRGGKGLSDTFISVVKKLHWQCAKKHTWKAKPNNIKKGNWCPQCSWQELAGEMPDRAKRKEHHTFGKAVAAAEARGGKCILPDGWESIIELFSTSQLEWECAKGHRWQARYYGVVKNGRWCPECAKKIRADANRKYSINDMQVLAALKGGKCLSQEFLSIKSKILWECDKGHQWEARPDSIKQGGWCPQCAKVTIGNACRQYTIEDMQALAALKEGQCLSDVYCNNSTKLRWRCREGHEWEARPNDVKRGTWCPTCGKKRVADAKRRYTIEDMKVWAQGQGGDCLSDTFKGLTMKLHWRCKEGHEWEARPNNIMRGTWCPHCPRKRR